MHFRRTNYFDAALAAIVADMAADDAASIAAEAAIIDEAAADDAESIAAEAGADIVAGGVVVVVVVVVSSFLLQAAKETAAASVTMSNAVFIFLLDLGFGQSSGNCGNPLTRSPIVQRQGKRRHSRA